MRDFIIIVVIIVTISWGSIQSLHFYERLLESMKDELFILENQFQEDNNRKLATQKIEEIWLKNENWLIILQDHASIGNIEDNLYECLHYYQENDLSHFRLYKEKVVSGFEDIIKREKLLLVDIF